MMIFIYQVSSPNSQSLKCNVEKNLSMGNDDHAKIENGKEKKIENNKRQRKKFQVM